MKYQFEELKRYISDNELLKDIQRTAKKLKKNRLSANEYAIHGKYTRPTITKRFGSWNAAVKMAGLEINTFNIPTKKHVLLDIKRTAKVLGVEKLSYNKYSLLGRFSKTQIRKLFGSWAKAVEEAGLKPGKMRKATDMQLLNELKQVWDILERQPRCSDITEYAKYGLKTYVAHFGSWNKTLQAFKKYIYGKKISKGYRKRKHSHNTNIHTRRIRRSISASYRFMIFKRDKFKCKFCGRSPATDLDVQLQVDHIIPWSKGGETVPKNLQTLCYECNIGKGNAIN